LGEGGELLLEGRAEAVVEGGAERSLRGPACTSGRRGALCSGSRSALLNPKEPVCRIRHAGSAHDFSKVCKRTDPEGRRPGRKSVLPRQVTATKPSSFVYERKKNIKPTPNFFLRRASPRVHYVHFVVSRRVQLSESALPSLQTGNPCLKHSRDTAPWPLVPPLRSNPHPPTTGGTPTPDRVTVCDRCGDWPGYSIFTVATCDGRDKFACGLGRVEAQASLVASASGTASDSTYEASLPHPPHIAPSRATYELHRHYGGSPPTLFTHLLCCAAFAVLH
jgi:hypothetical protein